MTSSKIGAFTRCAKVPFETVLLTVSKQSRHAGLDPASRESCGSLDAG